MTCHLELHGEIVGAFGIIRRQSVDFNGLFLLGKLSLGDSIEHRSGFKSRFEYAGFVRCRLAHNLWLLRVMRPETLVVGPLRRFFRLNRIGTGLFCNFIALLVRFFRLLLRHVAAIRQCHDNRLAWSCAE